MLPQCSHITRKRGVYYYRRRLPRPHDRDVTLSPRTKHLHEAQHPAVALDHSFEKVIEEAHPAIKGRFVTGIGHQTKFSESLRESRYWSTFS